MFPVLFEIGGVPVQSYGFFIALGYVAALLLTRRLATSQGLSASDFSDLTFFCLLVGILGARILFLLTNFGYFLGRPGEILSFWSGGLVFYGGFLLVLPMLFFFFRNRGIAWKTGLDVLAPGLALGHGIGRIGCLAAGCCHGSYCEYPWAVHLNTDLVEPALRGLPVHPVQVYESVGLILLSAGLLWLYRRKPASGTVAAAYVMGYALLRFLVEFFRGDSIRGSAFGVSTSQLLALALFAAVGALLLYRRRKISNA
jgi:phosphatidylglycerol---prolipoprotein diacylglyceryl transferase